MDGLYLSDQCRNIRELVSAQLDDELISLNEFEQLTSHLVHCQACARWQASTLAMSGPSRIRRTELVPDLSASIMASISNETRLTSTPSLVPMARLGLLVLSIALLVGAITSLANRNPEVLLAGGSHSPQELFGFQFALSVGFAVAAWKPHWAGGLAVSSSVAAAVLIFTAFTGMETGTTTGTLEFNHVLEVAGALLTCVISRQSPTIWSAQRVEIFAPR